MTEPNKINLCHKTISTVTKHIKIYSDNPFHDCIDRIIEASVMFDSIDTDEDYHLSLLQDAATDLFDTCIKERHKLTNNTAYKLDEQNPT